MLQRRRSAGRLLLCKSSALNTSTTSTKGSITLVLHCENQTLSRTTTKPPAPNENDVLKPERNPLVYAPVFQPFVPPARPPFSPVFLSGLRFVNVTWTPQKTKEIKQRRFEVALGSFKLGYDVPFLATYQKIHERKSKKQKKIEEKEEIEERNREKAFKKSLHGYEESWRQLWGRQMSYAYVPYPDPLPTEDEWKAKSREFFNPENLRPYQGLSTAAAIDKYVNEMWGKDMGPVAKKFTDWHRPGMERRIQPYINPFNFDKNFPDPWNFWNYSNNDYGLDYESRSELIKSRKIERDMAKWEQANEKKEQIEEEITEETLEERGKNVGEGDDFWGFDRSEEEVNPEANRGDPEELIVDFRTLALLEDKMRLNEVHPYDKPPAKRTKEEKERLAEDRTLFTTFYEMRTWTYMRKRLQKHGLLPVDEGPTISEGEQAAVEAEETKEDKEQGRREWLLQQLAKDGVKNEEDTDEQLDLLATVDRAIDSPDKAQSTDRQLLESIRAKKWRIKKYMDAFLIKRVHQLPEPDKEFPLQFTTTYDFDPDVVMGPLARKEFMQRKVIMRVHVPALGLTKPALNRLIELVGPRYDPQTEVLKLVGDRHPNKKLNKLYVQQMFRELVSNALLADPNYVPLSDLNASDVTTLIPRPELPIELQEELVVLEVPPNVKEEMEHTRKKAKEFDYRLFHFNLFKPKKQGQHERALNAVITKVLAEKK